MVWQLPCWGTGYKRHPVFNQTLGQLQIDLKKKKEDSLNVRDTVDKLTCSIGGWRCSQNRNTVVVYSVRLDGSIVWQIRQLTAMPQTFANTGGKLFVQDKVLPPPPTHMKVPQLNTVQNPHQHIRVSFFSVFSTTETSECKGMFVQRVSKQVFPESQSLTTLCRA
jgi:hypothetical protein